MPDPSSAGNILGGLNSGVQGYEQGAMFKEQQQQSQIANQTAQAGLAEKALPYYQMMIRQNPAMRTDPAFVGQVNKTLKPLLGVGFDPQQGIPEDFAKPDFLNPDTYAKTQAAREESFARSSTQLLTNPNIGPAEKIQGLQMMATAMQIDPSVIANLVSNSGVTGEMQSEYGAKLQSLFARANLDQTKVGQIQTMMPYMINQSIARAGEYNAQAQNQQSLVDWRPKELQVKEQALESNNQYRFASLQQRATNDLVVNNIRARSDFSRDATAASQARRQLANEYLAQMSATAIAGQMSPQDLQDTMKKAQTLLDEADSIDTMASSVTAAPQTNPALPGNQTIHTPGKQTQQQPQSKKPGVPYSVKGQFIIIQGVNAGKAVINGMMGTPGQPKPDGPYTPSPDDVYVPLNP